MKMGYRQFCDNYADGNTREIDKFRSLFPDTYSRFFKAYMSEKQGKTDVVQKRNNNNSLRC